MIREQLFEEGPLTPKAPRIDGPLKVTGSVMYASDHHFPDMLYAVPVCSSIASGTILSMDTTVAEKMPGVKKVYHQGNIGPLYRVAPGGGLNAVVAEHRPAFADDKISYFGQYVAAVVAVTLEQATAAANAVKVRYRVDKHDVREHLESEEKPKIESERGDPDSAFTSAPVQIDASYTTPVETHSPIELNATVAVWDGQNFTLYETSQAVMSHRTVMAEMLGVPSENVRVLCRFLGSGFGNKLYAWPHCLIAAVTARELNRPIKLVISRRMMFQNVGHRARTQQRVKLGATHEGKLLSLSHDWLSHTSMLDDYEEPCGEATAYAYSTANLRTSSIVVRRHVGPPCSMRGPGAVPGLFALESAMDELAIKLQLDPVELRIRNEPEHDESLNMPFSSRHLLECLEVGAKKFGWSQRNHRIGSMARDGLIVGWGMSPCSWMAERQASTASVTFRNDGTVRVATGSQDIGTGTYTAMAQIITEKVGIPHERVEVLLGDSNLPPGPMSGGSWATASLIPAVCAAIEKAQQKLFIAALSMKTQPFLGKTAKDLEVTSGRVHIVGQSPLYGVPFEYVLKASGIAAVASLGESEGTLRSPTRKFSTHSFGAHFVEVTWEPATARLRIPRIVTVIDAGHILNPKPARNQIEGAIVMGVGMALFEETIYEDKLGAPLNSNFADYMMTTNADSPSIDVTFLDYPDKVLNELGARGVGEIGLAGIAPAITSAVHHATGVRVRKLPIRIEDLLVG